MTTEAAGEGLDGAGRAGPAGKIAIDDCWMAGWAFLVTRLHRVLPLVWIPALAIVLVERSGLNAKAIAAYGPLGAAGMGALYVLLWTLVGGGAYRVAFDRAPGAILAQVEIGAAELRYFLAKSAFWLIVNGMLLGGLLLGARIVQLLVLRDVLVLPATANLTTAQWTASLGPFGYLAIGSPVVFALCVMAWFGARYALVFPAACAGERTGIFEALALTRRNAWHMFGLLLLLAISLAILFWFSAAALGVWGMTQSLHGTATAVTSGSGNPQTVLENTLKKLTSTASPHPWLGAAVDVAKGTVWQIVFAGALAKAYRSLKPE